VNRATSATDTVSSTPVDILTNTITIGILSIPNADVTQRPTPILIDDQLDDSTPINMSILNINNIHNVHNNNNIHNIQEQRQSTISTIFLRYINKRSNNTTIGDLDTLQWL